MYPADLYWNMPGRQAYDPREVAWVEADDLRRLRKYIAGGRPTQTETVSVHYPNPQRVEIEARLEQPGLVILADVFYPGWKLQIDEAPSPVVQANGMMHAAAVEAGFHRLVYFYEPGSFRSGLAVTRGTSTVLLVVGFWALRSRPNRAGILRLRPR